VHFLSPSILHTCTVSSLIVGTPIPLTGILTNGAKYPTPPASVAGLPRKRPALATNAVLGGPATHSEMCYLAKQGGC